MIHEQTFARIEEVGIIAAVRVPTEADAMFGAETVLHSGIPIVEVTLTTPAAIGVIARLVQEHPKAVIGAGTVLDTESAEACMNAGAKFLTNTGLDPEIVEFSRKHEFPMIPGALTPGEILMARKAGAAFIKVFPCANLGGPAYIRAIKRPFPGIRLIAAGGVTQLTAEEYIRAGASVLGIGHDLLPQEAIRTRNAEWITELSHRFQAMVKQARNEKNYR